MKWKNTGTAPFTGHRKIGADPDFAQMGAPVMLAARDDVIGAKAGTGEFDFSPSVGLACEAGKLAPVDDEAKAALREWKASR